MSARQLHSMQIRLSHGILEELEVRGFKFMRSVLVNNVWGEF